MSVQVINIDPAHEDILSFLFPTYSVSNSPAVTTKFITHRDVKSKREREALSLYYSDCVFISTQIFDEFWDENKIKEEAVRFVHIKFRSRKHSVKTETDTFNQDVLSFMFDLVSPEQESRVLELFEMFGSARFPALFINIVNTVPLPVVRTAMNTFISKILMDNNSLFYKKKSALYREKIRNNFIPALDQYLVLDKDPFGLSDVKFYMDLIK